MEQIAARRAPRRALSVDKELIPVIAADVHYEVAGPGSQGETVRAVTRIEVVWDAGDWRAIAPPGGDWGNSAARLSSLAGYTNFPGQG